MLQLLSHCELPDRQPRNGNNVRTIGSSGELPDRQPRLGPEDNIQVEFLLLPKWQFSSPVEKTGLSINNRDSILMSELEQ